MFTIKHVLFLAALSVVTVAPGIGFSADKAPVAGWGPNPALPNPEHSLLPTIKIAEAQPWPSGMKPAAAQGLAVSQYAENLDHPRWLYVLPNGDVLVAETNAPDRPDDQKGFKNWVAGLLMKKAGAGVASPNRITLLRGLKSDGSATEKSVFLEGLNSPFGMALVGDQLYVANTDALIRFKYQSGDLKISVPGVKVADLPAGPLNHHWTKNVIANKDGSKLYVTVGSNSNVAENGIDKEDNRAAILEVDPASGASRVYASGLRNPNGMGFEPESGQLWTVVNERDELGNDLVPDYLTSVKENAFYGWPYSYIGQNVDDRVSPQRPELVQKALVPDYGLGSHTASLGLVFSAGAKLLPASFAKGAFIGQHGSWNRKPVSGYKVVFIPFSGGKPAGEPHDVLTGFINDNNQAYGRPVGVAIAADGSLLVADDVGNKVWRVATALAPDPSKQPAPATN